ncbi:hypothetical protein DP939_37980 [Spongiactinospora rosea]|uniref:Uncharacterized protein n=1 Tax=Spongiactinospora rosea TaxID=2248750 RepID=A0A366LNI3_9ACTN|nr:peptidase inhibitor family I36 protein [Spongiactinospora rosea]RBQ14979.1 hypothetical protein DP939_37980 [Spongiactinospora rosea]
MARPVSEIKIYEQNRLADRSPGDDGLTARWTVRCGSGEIRIGSWINGLTSSIWNRTGYTVCFYEHINASGRELIRIGPGGWSNNVGSGANDKISSYTFC